MEVDKCRSRRFSTKIQVRSAHFDERSSRTTSVMCINPGHIVTPVTPSARRGQARINSQEDFAMSEPVTPLTNVGVGWGDRKSTRLNSSHVSSSYAVFCLKKKK